MKAREVLGTALVGVGAVGVILPIVPGWPFLLAAVALLGPDHRLTRPFVGLFQRARSFVSPGCANVTTPTPDTTPSPANESTVEEQGAGKPDGHPKRRRRRSMSPR